LYGAANQVGPATGEARISAAPRLCANPRGPATAQRVAAGHRAKPVGIGRHPRLGEAIAAIDLAPDDGNRAIAEMIEAGVTIG